MIRPLLLTVRWLFWAWVASPWSGGGSGHPSYPHARLSAHLARANLQLWLRGAR